MVFSVFLTQTCTTYRHADVCTQPCSFFNYWIILRCAEIKIIYLTSQGALSDSFGVQSYHLRCLVFQVSRKIPACHCRELSPESVRIFSYSLVEFMVLYKNPTDLGLGKFGVGGSLLGWWCAHFVWGSFFILHHQGNIFCCQFFLSLDCVPSDEVIHCCPWHLKNN